MSRTDLRLERRAGDGIRPIVAASAALQLAVDRLRAAGTDCEEPSATRRQAERIAEAVTRLNARLYSLAANGS